MNIQNLMTQARKIQGEVEKITKEIENSTFIEENDVVYIEMNGKNEIIKFNIKNNDVLNDKEMLEDMILLVINKILVKIKSEKDAKLGKYTGGMGGLF